MTDQPVEKVVITKVNDQNTVTLTDEKKIEILQQSFQEAQKLDGVMDIRKQDYEITFYFEDDETKTLWMWLTKKSGMAMDPDDTNIGYDLKQTHVEDLHTLDVF